MLYDTVIQMIRGIDPIVAKNPFVLPGTPKADFRIMRAGLFIIVKTKVCYFTNFVSNEYFFIMVNLHLIKSYITINTTILCRLV